MLSLEYTAEIYSAAARSLYLRAGFFMAELVQFAPGSGRLRANVILVHGLGGDARGTWTGPPPANMLWPAWLAEDFEGIAVWSVGYDSPVTNWRGSAMELSDRGENVFKRLLTEDGIRSGELILVGHSLGGLVIKQLLRKAEAEAHDNADAAELVNRVRKVAFLATPHAGADMADWADRLRNLVRPSAATRALIRNDQHLRDLNLWYRGFARRRQIDHLILVETKKTSMFGMIVKPDSSDPGLSVNPIPVDADHISIAKPTSPDDEIYRFVRAFIVRKVERPVSIEEKKIDELRHETKVIRENVERATAELSMTNAQREVLTADLAKVKSDLHGTNELVSGFLEIMVGRKVAPEQFASTLFKLVADYKSAGEKINALTFSSNMSPRLSQIRDDAKAAHEAGRLDEAEALLADIARLEIEALKKLEDHEREIQEEIRLRKRNVAEIKAAQAAVAHSRLNYMESAALYGEAASLVAALDEDAQWYWLLEQARALTEQGDEFGDNEALSESIRLYREILSCLLHDSNSLQRALTQKFLGDALSTLARRKGDKRGLEEAVKAFREALKTLTPELFPLQWPEVQDALGSALRMLGEVESGTEKLEEAAAAYREALSLVTPEHGRSWVTRRANLAIVLIKLGERETGTDKLQEAVSLLRESLKEYRRESDPLDWAKTQNNLGTALQALAKRENGTGSAAQAVAAHCEALKENTRERAPLQWAMTQNNLGAALLLLGCRGENDRLEEAILAFREALKEVTRERAPLDWAMTQHNIGAALDLLGQRGSTTESLEAAVEAYRSALNERTRERTPLDWAMTQHNLGRVLVMLAIRRKDVDALKEGIVAFREALKERTRERVPLQWEETESFVTEAERLLSLW